MLGPSDAGGSMKTITLRKLRSLWDSPTVDERYSSDTSAAVRRTSFGTWENLPLLSKHGSGAHTPDAYSKKIDRMIAKHGPDAEFDYDETGEENNDQTNPNERIDNHVQQQQGVRAGFSNVMGQSPFLQTNEKRDGTCNIVPSGSDPRTFGCGSEEAHHSGNTVGGLPAALGKGGTPNPSSMGKGCTGPASPGGDQETIRSGVMGETAGVGTQPDAIEKDAFRPITAGPNGLKTLPYLEANERCSAVWGMYPHPTYSTSFQAFTRLPKYRLPPIKAGCLSYVLPAAATVDENFDIAEFSTENRFGDANPGGHIDAALARLGSKRLRAQSRSMQSRMEMIFRMNEVGVGQDETPRLSAKRLIKELVGRSLRMGRTRKEERGAGLKLILVDVSPSCAAIRDACYAAALGIADADPDVVVFAHFNGYVHCGEDGEMMVGRRWAEIPLLQYETISEDKVRFRAFLATGALAGAIAFGDGDAAELYTIISEFCPMVWLSPTSKADAEFEAKHSCSNGYMFDKAALYIVPDITDALSAVRGMEAVLKAKKL
jgi:hypothetical protein